MAKGTNYWKRKDESGYMQLDPAMCYKGTSVWVYSKGYKRWTFKIVNFEETPQTEHELARKRGHAETGKAWKRPQSAKRHAQAARFHRDWLEAAGITFKDEEDE